MRAGILQFFIIILGTYVVFYGIKAHYKLINWSSQHPCEKVGFSIPIYQVEWLSREAGWFVSCPSLQFTETVLLEITVVAFLCFISWNVQKELFEWERKTASGPHLGPELIPYLFKTTINSHAGIQVLSLCWIYIDCARKEPWSDLFCPMISK